MDGLQPIIDEHRAVEALFGAFEQLGAATPTRVEAIARQIVDEVRTHLEMEEAVLYRALEDVPEALAAADQGLAEHDVIGILLLELDGMTPHDKGFEARVSVLIDMFRGHLRREETEVLSLARRAFDPVRLNALSGDMLAYRAR